MSNCSRSDLRGLLPQVLRALGGSRRRRSHQLRRPCWRLSCHGKRLAHEEASNLRIGDPHHLDQARAPSPAEQQLLLGGGRAVSLGRGGEVIGENPAALDLLCSLLSICCCPRCLSLSLSFSSFLSFIHSLSLSFSTACFHLLSISFLSLSKCCLSLSLSLEFSVSRFFSVLSLSVSSRCYESRFFYSRCCCSFCFFVG